MSQIWQENLAALKEHQPELYAVVVTHDYQPVGEVIATPAGVPTLQFITGAGLGPLAYNAQDPWLDTDLNLETVEAGSRGLAIFIGMGLGYGSLRVFRERSTLGMMVIVEPSLDLLLTALHEVDLRPLLTAKKVHWLVGEELDLSRFELLVARIASLENTHLLRHVPSFQWRENLYMPRNQQVFEVVNQLNVSGGTTSKVGGQFFRNRLANLSLLRHSVDLGFLKNLFAGKPAVLVAAGPSLDRSLDDLKKVVGRCVLFAVDSALAPLLKAGIVPDFVASLDFSSLNFEKLAPFTRGDWPFSLVVTAKGTPLVLKRLKVRHLFMAFNEDTPQEWICKAIGIKDYAPFGFSVAHLSLGLALQMGCNPITFVGQDLCYTSGAADHAAGTVIMREGVPTDREIFEVPGVGGTVVTTDRGMMSLQNRFEDIIAGNSDRTYYNASVAGVQIKGTEPVSLARLAEQFVAGEQPVAALVDQAVAAGSPFAVAALLTESGKIIKNIKKVERYLGELLVVTAEVRREVGRLRQKKAPIRKFEGLPAPVARKLLKFDQLNKAIDASNAISEQILELTYPILAENDRLRARNDEIQGEEGYLCWLQAEFARIEMVNRERYQALSLYRELLHGLSRHLAREGELLGGQAGALGGQRCLELGRLYLGAGDYQLAREAIAAALALAPDSGEALLLAGEMWAGLLDFAQANANWEKAVGQVPAFAAEVRAQRLKHAAFWIAMGEEHGNSGELGDNVPSLLPVWLGRVAALLPEEEEIPDSLQHLWQKHAARMTEWLALGKNANVRETLAGWEVFGLRFPEVLVFRAQLAAAEGDSAAAIAALELAVGQNSAQPKWLLLLARELFAAGRFDQAIARLQAAVALDPGSAGLWEEVGDALAADGDFAGAIVAFEQCYRALPHRHDVLQKMGDCYLRDNQPEAAKVTYQAVLAQRSSLPGATPELVEP